ncbi:glycosyltransferase [Ramlibacter algicola]|uniref:Glycosyltransferase family 4 protein n=1 Tax=Ramlibacter algicola TaxID=2795217 RepID=A0A934UQX8_9BURK|nr:glycosyltransferase [Ramlibacter algicola]MBK0391972.1 glycosyltransferase family 4 protein [Ramlibacter algicola]
MYYVAWQLGAFFKARKLCMGTTFDVVHHITWGTFRYPSFLALLRVPLVFGPVGGGERTPLGLLRGLPLKSKVFEIARAVGIHSARLDPLWRLLISRTFLIACKTEETRACIPAAHQGRAVVHAEIGAEVKPARSSIQSQRPMTILYVGRLVGLKGLHISLHALADLKRHGIAFRFRLVGDGPHRRGLEQLALDLGLRDQVVFEGAVSRQEVDKYYNASDIFLFTSLHDSSGNVITEALSHGLPVVCLSLGGPKYFANDLTGRVIEARNRTFEQIVGDLSKALADLCNQPQLRESCSLGARNRATELSWARQVSSLYRLIEQRLKYRRPVRNFVD